MRNTQKRVKVHEDDFPRIRHERKQDAQILEDEELDELLEYMNMADTKRWKL
jgi:DNA-directed RNA polymerase subunit H (RpoH/RPB5)